MSGNAGEKHYRWQRGDLTFQAAHLRLRKAHPYTGHCQLCEVSDGRRTEWAKLDHSTPYTDRREDYLEAHRACHQAYDEAQGVRARDVRTGRFLPCPT